MSIDGNSIPANDIEVIKSIYSAINRHDIAGSLQYFDSKIERVEPEDFPTPGVYRGHAEMEAHLKQGRSTWAEGGCEPKRFFVHGNKIVVYLHVHVRLKDKTEWIDAYIADFFKVVDGKAIEMRSFLDLKSALEWAGMNEENHLFQLENGPGSIATLRHEIDQIHGDLYKLLLRRRDLTLAIWKIKQEQGLPFFNSEREQQIMVEFSQKASATEDPAFENLLKSVMSHLLREYEKYLRSHYP